MSIMLGCVQVTARSQSVGELIIDDLVKSRHSGENRSPAGL